VDILGCRPALELADPVLEALPDSVQKLVVRMCGPEVGEEVARRPIELPPGRRGTVRILEFEVRQGLYHDLYE
ncbi:unnamed protein product, partial [Polarella glacialis]